MKVTEEMVERAINDWVERSGQALGSRTLKTGEVARGMLEAALAPLPEPIVDGHDCAYWRRNYEHAEEECTAERDRAGELEARLAAERRTSEALQAALNEAEAKLEKVRAWLYDGRLCPENGDLLAILDLDEAP